MLFGFKNTQKTAEPPAPAQTTAPASVSPAPSASGLEPPNPSRCLDELNRVFDQKKPKGAALKLYLENFKLFNDTFGYSYGELLLKEVDAFLRQLDGARVLRCGGVEFLILLERQGFTQATETADAIRDRFEETWRINDMDYMCSMSLGMVLYPDGAETAQEVMRFLEYAVSEASQNGQNALAVFNTELRKKLHRKSGIAKLIHEALLSGQIEVRYRPTFNVEKGIFTRAECYLRILSPEFGVVGAAEFLPIAEDSGQICAINSYAIHTACEQVRRLLDEGVEFESISVPISPVQFLQEQFLDEMKEIVEQYQIPNHKLAFEITESVLVNSFNRVNIVMQELSKLGIEFVLNEFGTGYSGINNILDLPVDVLKLERTFVWQLETNPRSGYLIDGLIRIAHNLGLKLIAEGVETENQLRLLSLYGCRYEQGFYYSPTVLANELSVLLGKGREAIPQN